MDFEDTYVMSDKQLRRYIKSKDLHVAYDEEMLLNIQMLAGKGFTLQQIADYLGVSYLTFNNHRNQYDAIDVAVRRGKAKAISLVTGCLFKKINDGDMTGIIFYLKTRAGWHFEDKGSNINQDENTSSNNSCASNCAGR